ncbi:MAG: hypothetical protein AUH78_19505 [Gemmatimonadetes bacterium 13_1_40CM_4_69_8]|nr:MAG: hypothetical protein AUH78_19505 [Gemmatimonadetes bacterium 13_1_40CM_4_69_8]
MIDTPSEPDPAEDDFPEGDGTADSEALVVCPHCGAASEVGLDPGGGAHQQYVEDCQVCCRPWRVTVRYSAAGSADVSVEPLDG